ncbi:MAG TPA: SusD/RagB family nutrient-binding outer membrane lipoprotein [Cyclobacteriaceae bacterium]|nr:SusD/RagB family nutrient-binding outer membrane lipoprotein [Cyclobacteriaceae bacterium]
MKKILNITVLTLSIVAASSCDSGFDELNTSKTGATALNPALILNNAIINSSPNSGQLNFELPIVQQVTTPNTGVLEGGNFNKNNPNSSINNWQGYYRNVVRYTNDVISRTAEDPALSNLLNKARIIQAQAYMVITDTYGNVPYDEGGKGYIDQNFFPAYQDQQSIYQAILQELKSATDGLDASKASNPDVLYDGNIDKWKKFGYSLLLRAGMRLSKVDQATAQTTVATAFAGGVILDNADNAAIRHDGNYPTVVGNILTGTEAANFYLAEPFVDALQATNDPRLPAIAIRYVGANSGPAQTPAVGTTDPANQYGLPMGSTDGDADISGATLPGGGTRYAYSQLDRRRLGKPTSPMFIVTAAETNLLLAEARFRGWINTGTVDEYFSAGIKAHMDQLGLTDPGSVVAAADQDAYVAARLPLLAGNELEQINYEYWIAALLNGQEAWANFRRSGYPVLQVNPFPGRTVDWITRLPYPPNEYVVNNDNVEAAIADQGADNLDTRIWWDVE